MIKTLKDSEKSGFSLWILGSLDGQMTLNSTKRPSIEAQVIMTSSNLEHEGNIGGVILETIGDHHPVKCHGYLV